MQPGAARVEPSVLESSYVVHPEQQSALKTRSRFTSSRMPQRTGDLHRKKQANIDKMRRAKTRRKTTV
jgi:hypothetical protein